MTDGKRLISNTWFSFLSNFVRLGTNLLIFIYLARVLRIEDFGAFTFSFTFAMLFSYLANFGLDRVVIIEISRNRGMINHYFKNVMGIKTFISLITFFLAWLIINIMGYPQQTRFLVYILTASFILFSYVNFLYSIFRGIEKLEYETIATFLINIILIVSVIISVSLEYGITGIGFSFIISRLIGFVFALGLLRLKIEKTIFQKTSDRFDYSFCKVILNKAVPFALLAVLSAVIINIDTILLSYLKGDELVGYYQAAMKIVGTLTVIPFILDGSFFPRLSRLHEQYNEFEIYSKKLMTILIFLGAPLMIGLFALAHDIIVFIYGDGFMNSVVTFQILCVAILLRFSMKGYETILLVIDKEKVVFNVLLCASILNIALNIYLIQRFGHIGAAVTNVVTHMFIVMSYIYITKRSRNIFMLERSMILILLFGIISGIIIYNLRSLHFISLIVIFAACYLGSTLLLLKKERKYIFESMRSFGKRID